jgi:DNA-binding transcriptional LysR family regulator
VAASLRQLRAYALLLQERNFTRAAAAMHLSQPAFSALIGGLEESLGVRLFDRSKRHVAPTVEGIDFEGPARRVLAEFDAAVAGMHDRASLRRGRVSLALLPSLAAGWLPVCWRSSGRCIPASRSRWPTCSPSRASSG